MQGLTNYEREQIFAEGSEQREPRGLYDRKKEMSNITTYKGIPAMTSPKVHDYLYRLGQTWTAQGVAMELGCWLGGSAMPLLEGLKSVGYCFNFWAFDRWIANDEQVAKAKSEGMKLFVNEDLKPAFMENVSKIHSRKNVVSCQGNLPGSLHNFHQYADPIEICIFDAPKSEPVFSGCMQQLIKYFIPGVTTLGLLDYKFYERHNGMKRNRFMAPVNFMNKYDDHFYPIMHWEDECPVFFKYVKELKL